VRRPKKRYPWGHGEGSPQGLLLEGRKVRTGKPRLLGGLFSRPPQERNYKEENKIPKVLKRHAGKLKERGERERKPYGKPRLEQKAKPEGKGALPPVAHLNRDFQARTATHRVENRGLHRSKTQT